MPDNTPTPSPDTTIMNAASDDDQQAGTASNPGVQNDLAASGSAGDDGVDFGASVALNDQDDDNEDSQSKSPMNSQSQQMNSQQSFQPDSSYCDFSSANNATVDPSSAVEVIEANPELIAAL